MGLWKTRAVSVATALLLLLANELTSQFAKVAFRRCAKLKVMTSFFADHKFSAAIARVEPFGVCDSGAAGAVEANPSAQLNKWPALRQMGRFFVFHPDPCRAETVLLRGDRTHQNLIAGCGRADRPPVAGGEDCQSHEEDGGQHHGSKDNQALLYGRYRGRHKHAGDTLEQKPLSVNYGQSSVVSARWSAATESNLTVLITGQ